MDVDVIESVDEVEDSNVILEQRIGSLEEENSLLRTRLNLLESALSVLQNTTDTAVQGIFFVV